VVAAVTLGWTDEIVIVRSARSTTPPGINLTSCKYGCDRLHLAENLSINLISTLHEKQSRTCVNHRRHLVDNLKADHSRRSETSSNNFPDTVDQRGESGLKRGINFLQLLHREVQNEKKKMKSPKNGESAWNYIKIFRFTCKTYSFISVRV
jgi:hypothetical protein